MVNFNNTELAEGLTEMLKDQCEEGRTVMFDGTFDDSFNLFSQIMKMFAILQLLLI